LKAQRVIILVLAALAIGLLAWRLAYGGTRETPALSGYVEGETLYLASPVAGTISDLWVRRGQRVEAGERLFAMEPRQREAQSNRAAAEVQAALAQAADARKGQRPVELGILEADVDSAQAQARETAMTLERTRWLVGRGVYARARLDDALAAQQSAAARVAAARKRLEAATLGAREDQIRAADARVAQAQATQMETGARIGNMAPRAPAAGRIEEVFYQRSEWAAANQPVVALIPDGRVFVRFFVPEPKVGAYRPGARVRFSCDGCGPTREAVISYVSPRPEFTPPIIYSREARDRLVFMVEARPVAGGAALIPGVPVDVEPLK
jgi:HlyD family secretion protein